MTDPGDLVLAARWIVPVSAAPFGPGFVRVRAGRIAELGRGPAPEGALDLGEAALLPAFVDAHAHLACGFLKGAPPAPGFLGWIDEHVTPRVIAAARDEEERLVEAARDAARELLVGGVGTVGDGFFHDAGVAALRETGQRGIFFREFFGVSAPHDGDYLAACERRIDEDLARVPGGLLGYGLAPHAPYTCPAAILEGLAARAARDDLRLSIHVAESPEEDEFFRRRGGPMMTRFGGGERHDLGRSPVAALAARGALGPRTLLVHAVHLDEDDIELIARSGATVVHCPGSNQHLGVGVAPVVALRARGVPLAIATDSAASRGKLDLFEEMRLAVFAQRAAARNATALDAPAALEAVTLGGARALGLDDRIGTLEVGKEADLTAVRLDRLRHRPCVDPVFALVFSAQTDDVLGVWVAGRRLHARERGL